MADPSEFHGIPKPNEGKDPYTQDYYDFVENVDDKLEIRGTLAERPTTAPNGAKYIVDDPGGNQHGKVFIYEGDWRLQDRWLNEAKIETLFNGDSEADVVIRNRAGVYQALGDANGGLIAEDDSDVTPVIHAARDYAPIGGRIRFASGSYTAKGTIDPGNPNDNDGNPYDLKYVGPGRPTSENTPGAVLEKKFNGPLFEQNYSDDDGGMFTVKGLFLDGNDADYDGSCFKIHDVRGMHIKENWMTDFGDDTIKMLGKPRGHRHSYIKNNRIYFTTGDTHVKIRDTGIAHIIDNVVAWNASIPSMIHLIQDGDTSGQSGQYIIEHNHIGGGEVGVLHETKNGATMTDTHVSNNVFETQRINHVKYISDGTAGTIFRECNVLGNTFRNGSQQDIGQGTGVLVEDSLIDSIISMNTFNSDLGAAIVTQGDCDYNSVVGNTSIRNTDGITLAGTNSERAANV